MAVMLTDEQFTLLREYLDRQHTLVYDSDDVGHTVALGRRLWREIHALATVQDPAPDPAVRWTNRGRVDTVLYGHLADSSEGGDRCPLLR
jgi:hypothetical protein